MKTDELIKQNEVLKSELELERAERIRLENELISQKSNNFSFKKAGNIGKFGYWELDLNTMLITASDTAKNIYGTYSNVIPIDEVRMQALPEFKSLLQNTLSDLIKNNIPYNIEYKIQRLDGVIVDIHTIAELDKEQNLVFGTVQDITEKKKLEELLKISNAKYQTLFDTFPLGISISDKNGNILETNRRAEELLGLPAEVHNQRNIHSSDWKIIKPDGTAFQNEDFPSVKALIEDRLIQNVEMGIVRNDDSIVWLNVSAKPLKVGDYGVVVAYSDITKEKNEHFQLISSEEKYRTIIDNSKIGVFQVHKTGKVIYANKAMLDILEFANLKEFQDRETPLQYKNPEQREFLIEEVWEKGKVENYEITMYTKFGREVVVILNFVLINDLIHGTMLDISDRIVAEQALKKSEFDLEFAQQLAKLGNWTWELKSNKVKWSKGMFQVYDIDPETYDGNPAALLEIIHPDDKDAFLNSMNSNLSGKYSPSLEYRVIHRDGSVHTIYAEGYTDYDENGNPAIMMGTSQDITERKLTENALRESELRFRNIFNNAPIGIYRTNRKGDILMANPKLIEILGFDSFEDLQKRDIEYEGYEDTSSRKIFIEEIERNGFINNFEVIWKKKDGTNIYVNEHARCFYDENGNVLYYEGTVKDITARKIAEENLKKSNEELKNLNITKDKFFSIIAHDLKNPISNYKQVAELIYDSYHDLEEEELMNILLLMKNSASNLFALLENLLVWARSQSGKIKCSSSESNLYILLDNIVQLLQPSAHNKNLKLHNKVKLSAFAKMDVNLINTVIRNLISNSIKYTPEGGEISIASMKVGEFIHIAISDNGIGIEPSRIDNLFKIDENISTPGTKNEKGTGLGLILCKEFVEMHGGKIWVESELGKGTTFWFSLPN